MSNKPKFAVGDKVKMPIYSKNVFSILKITPYGKTYSYEIGDNMSADEEVLQHAN